MSSSGSSEVKGQRVKPSTSLQRCLFKRCYLKNVPVLQIVKVCRILFLTHSHKTCCFTTSLFAEKGQFVTPGAGEAGSQRGGVAPGEAKGGGAKD